MGILDLFSAKADNSIIKWFFSSILVFPLCGNLNGNNLSPICTVNRIMWSARFTILVTFFLSSKFPNSKIFAVCIVCLITPFPLCIPVFEVDKFRCLCFYFCHNLKKLSKLKVPYYLFFFGISQFKKVIEKNSDLCAAFNGWLFLLVVLFTTTKSG